MESCSDVCIAHFNEHIVLMVLMNLPYCHNFLLLLGGQPCQRTKIEDYKVKYSYYRDIKTNLTNLLKLFNFNYLFTHPRSKTGQNDNIYSSLKILNTVLHQSLMGCEHGPNADVVSGGSAKESQKSVSGVP